MSIHFIEEKLESHFGCAAVLKQVSRRHFYLFKVGERQVFVKTGPLNKKACFEAEGKGLEALKQHSQFRIPCVYFCDSGETLSFIAIEWIDLLPHTSQSQQELGQALALMHLEKISNRFGFEVDNTIGETPQINTWTGNWLTFFRRYRLEFQLQLVAQRFRDEEIVEKGRCLIEKLPQYFNGMAIHPSLLHGDLWQGNSARDCEGRPVLFDPAAYFGHCEAELSLMKMFGGFSDACFQAYHQIIPKETGFEEREKCYQLYHFLNHYNIFGSSYRSSCLHLLNDLLV